MRQEKIYSKGEVIGAYEVEGVVATGAMGIVYEAKPHPQLRADLRALGVERVALKMARLESLPEDRLEHKRLIERLDREFRTLIGLSHPDIVKVYDFAVEDGVPYYVMERVEGVTLAQELKARPRVGETLWSFGHLCGAVALLHDRGICHRDLKPSNVMIRREDGRPVLIDFGICLPLAERTLTRPDELLGTPAYLSPEYAEHWMDPEQEHAYVARPTDDVWAMGVMLYEMVTGGLPWRTPPERRELLLREIQTVTPPHPSDVAEVIARPVGDAVMRMLEKDFRKRPRNAREVLLMLGKAGESQDKLSRIPKRRKLRWNPKQAAEVSRAAEAKTPEPGPQSGDGERGQMLGVMTVAMMLVFVSFGGGWLVRSVSPGASPVSEPRTSTATDPKVDPPPVPMRHSNVQTQAGIHGLKMPDRPDPKWLKPASDGHCYNPETGERMQLFIALRGACWWPGAKINPKKPCPDGMYDPPPEVLKNSDLRYLWNMCFNPYVLSEDRRAQRPETP